MAIPKNSHRVGFFDFDSRKKTGEIKAADGLRFYGHGTWAADGSHFFASVFSEKTAEGYLSVFRKEDFKEVARHQVAKSFTHDIRWMPDQKTVAIACSGARTNFDEHRKVLSHDRIEPGKVCFFDTEKGKIVHEVSFPNPDEILGHMRISKSGLVHLISSNFSKIAHNYEGKRGLYETSMMADVCTPWVVPPEIADAAKGEFLSIELNEDQNVLAVTLPSNHLVLYYDQREKKFANSVPTNAGGLALDRATGLMNYVAAEPRSDRRGSAFVFADGEKILSHFLATSGRLI